MHSPYPAPLDKPDEINEVAGGEYTCKTCLRTHGTSTLFENLSRAQAHVLKRHMPLTWMTLHKREIPIF